MKVTLVRSHLLFLGLLSISPQTLSKPTGHTWRTHTFWYWYVVSFCPHSFPFLLEALLTLEPACTLASSSLLYPTAIYTSTFHGLPGPAKPSAPQNSDPRPPSSLTHQPGASLHIHTHTHRERYGFIPLPCTETPPPESPSPKTSTGSRIPATT